MSIIKHHTMTIHEFAGSIRTRIMREADQLSRELRETGDQRAINAAAGLQRFIVGTDPADYFLDCNFVNVAYWLEVEETAYLYKFALSLQRLIEDNAPNHWFGPEPPEPREPKAEDLEPQTGL